MASVSISQQYTGKPVFIPLDGEWRFCVDPEGTGIERDWTAAGFDDSSWEKVIVPHTWAVDLAHADFEGYAWYRRTFRVPQEYAGAHIRLRFQAVFYLARVWLNGKFLGSHEGGYTSFEFDVSQQVIPGEENTLAIQVDNLRAIDRLPAHLYEGRTFGWKNYGGIVRSCVLEITGKAFIAKQRITAVPQLRGVNEADIATIKASLAVRNTADQPIQATLTASILEEATGRLVSQASLGAWLNLPPGECIEVALAVDIPSPRLWHFDHPDLYRWEAILQGADGATLHVAEEFFGVRSIELRGAHFYLNGEAVRLVGLSRHADTPEYGLAETAGAMQRDYNDLKLLNMVLSRPVHYPQSQSILDYCDRNGVLLIPELPAWQLTAGQMADEHMRQLARGQLREMIEDSYNHPCVWAWSVGNELESDTVAGRAFVRDMISYVKSLDSTRPVSFASYHLLVGRPWADATRYADFVMMNQYFGTWHGPKGALSIALDAIHSTWPDKPVIISEYGIAPNWQNVEGPELLEPEQYYFVARDQPAPEEAYDALRQNLIREQMEVFRSKPFVAGAIFWNYAGPMGVVDENRQRRGSWAVLREEHSPVCIESVQSTCLSQDRQHTVIRLRARGPLDSDLPVYTLRGYRLQWQVTSADKKTVYAQGEILIPELPPSCAWSDEIVWDAPPEETMLTFRIVRPGGYNVLECSYDNRRNRSHGE